MLLAIDTCGATGGVALGHFSGEQSSGSEKLIARQRLSSLADRKGFRLVAERELLGKTYSERLLSTVAAMLREADADLSQLSAVIVVNGPGSFTGIRIGVSAAKGLAEGLSIPVIALSRLDLLARKAPDSSAAAVLDAGRGEFYAGLYRPGMCETETLLTPDSLRQALQDSELPLFVCEDRVDLALADLHPRLVAAPTATDALTAGVRRFVSRSFDDPSTLDANYVRRSETEMLARIAEHAARRTAGQTISSRSMSSSAE